MLRITSCWDAASAGEALEDRLLAKAASCAATAKSQSSSEVCVAEACIAGASVLFVRWIATSRVEVAEMQLITSCWDVASAEEAVEDTLRRLLAKAASWAATATSQSSGEVCAAETSNAEAPMLFVWWIATSCVEDADMLWITACWEVGSAEECETSVLATSATLLGERVQEVSVAKSGSWGEACVTEASTAELTVMCVRIDSTSGAALAVEMATGVSGTPPESRGSCETTSGALRELALDRMEGECSETAARKSIRRSFGELRTAEGNGADVVLTTSRLSASAMALAADVLLTGAIGCVTTGWQEGGVCEPAPSKLRELLSDAPEPVHRSPESADSRIVAI
jgi:hypothetical protein